MSFRFSGKNFQAWDEFDLDVAGLTVVVGPSNEGKSSLFRALKGIIRNELNAGFVRVGSDEMKLTLEMDNHVVVASRTKKVAAEYTIDGGGAGKEFKKLNQKVPEPVQALGLGLIQIGDIVLDPVFAWQGAPQFMVQEQPTALNTILGAFSSTEKLEQGKREALRRIQEKNTEAKLLAIEKQKAEQLKDTLAPLAVRALLIQAEVGQLAAGKDRLDILAMEVHFAIRQMEWHRHIESTLYRLHIPQTTQCARGVQVVEATTLAIVARQRRGWLTALAGKLTIPHLGEVIAAADIVQSTGNLVQANTKLAMNRAWFTKTDELTPIWKSIVAQYKVINAISEVMSRGGIHGRQKKALISLEGRLHLQQELRELLAGQFSRIAAIDAYAARVVATERIQEAQKLIEVHLGILRPRERVLLADIERQTQLLNTVICPQCGAQFHQGEKPCQMKAH